VDPKPFSEAARRGLDWILETQHADGGWGQGEEAAHMGRSVGAPSDVSNVGDSCISLLALIRAGGLEEKSPYAGALRRGLAFVCGKVEAADEDSLHVTDVHGTRLQMKIGTNVDTFLASMALSEAKGAEGTSGDPALDRRVDQALAKVLRKIHANQRNDGTWENRGWAPVLSLSIAGKGLNRAAQAGADLPSELLGRSEDFFIGFDEAAPSAEAAGVALYSSSAGLGGLQEFANSGVVKERDLKLQLAEAKDDETKRRIEADLAKVELGRKQCEEAQQSVVARLDNPSFVAGFGSNGGEEFLSYMNISESLVLRGDDTWRRWDQAMAGNLGRVQNQDGSWSGHHCITGRNFCTATAVLVLLADRTPVPPEVVAAARSESKSSS
jgi:hypothetical protein